VQNYFHDRIERYRLKDAQNIAHSDSIGALSQRSEQFCNTIKDTADINGCAARADAVIG
jgi:hypothetical protein